MECVHELVGSKIDSRE